MEMPSFLQSKQVLTPDSGGFFTDRKKKAAFVTLLVLVFVIPLTVWLAQRAQIFAPKAEVVPIALVTGADSCVVSTDPNKVSCASFPIRLTSPLGPPTQVYSCTSDSQCQSGNKCFNYQNYPGTCKPSDTVCAGVITRACIPANTSECVDFPDPCHVPPGWTGDNGNRNSPTPTPTPGSEVCNVRDNNCPAGKICQPICTEASCPDVEPGTGTCQPNASPSPTAVACTTIALSKTSVVNSGSSITYTYIYPESTKIYRIILPESTNLTFVINNKEYGPQAVREISGPGTSSFSFTIKTPDACQPFTFPFKMVNSCGTTMSDFVGAGSAAAYGSVCATASPSPSASVSNTRSIAPSSSPGGNQGVSSGVDELGVNLGSVATCQGGGPVVIFSNSGRSDTNNFQIYRDGQPLAYTFAGPLNRPPSTQMKDTGLVYSTQYSYYIQAVDGPLAGKKSNTITVSTPGGCFSVQNIFQRLVNGLNSNIVSKVDAEAPSIESGLISNWKFDEISGNTAVDSKGVSNGAVTNAAIVDGKVNKARQIAAANSKIIVPDVPAYAVNYFTVAGWVKPQSFGLGNFVSIFSRRNQTNNQGLTLEYSGYDDAGAGQLQCVVFLNGGPNDEIRVANTKPFKLNLNQWNHAACSYDGSAVRVYINGVLAGTAAKTGTMKNGSGMEIKIGQNLYEATNSLNGTIDELAYWNRALTDSEIQTLAGIAPSPSPTAVVSPSPTPVGSLLPGTSFYKVAETEAGLAGATLQPYINTHGIVVDFTFSDPSPGVKQIWAEFTGADYSTKKEHISVEVVEPAPQITSFDCSMDISKQNLKLTFNGARLGSGSGKVTLDSKDAQILTWGANQVTAMIKPDGNLEDGKLFKAILTRGDGKVLPEVTCQVGTTLISLGARLFCREPGKFDVNNVKVTLVDENGNKANEEVSIDASGLIKGLQTKLQVGKLYAISVKAPFSIRRNAQFTAANGTNIISPADGEVFILPVGDIAPVILPDGKINTLDRSEIVRQWSVLGSGMKTADFNRDTRVNSIDWACMRYDFNAEDQAIPEKASPVLPSPVPSTTASASVSASASPITTTSPTPAASGQRSAYFLLEPLDGGSYPNGDEFVVRVNLWSQKEAANLFSAKLSFDPSALEVVRIEKGTALITWAEENFNNQTGSVDLTAGLPNPGLLTVEGNDPVMARIVFKGKKVGTATIAVTEASKIYSNSDNTNILTSLLSTQVAITQ